MRTDPKHHSMGKNFASCLCFWGCATPGSILIPMHSAFFKIEMYSNAILHYKNVVGNHVLTEML